jgi:predicted AlkP superfamily phosphohydrolase/phosphomutase
MTQVISLGLDGAAWHKLDRLIDEGHLPNLSALVDEGARAPLRTVDPPVTCPAWRCSTSGKNPGKLGVFWWLSLNRETGEFFHPDATSFDTADIWDYLSAEGCRSAILNVPMTYPPSELDGTMVSGFGAPFEDQWEEGDSITHPPSFQEELFEKYDWEVVVDHLTARDGPKRAYRAMESRFELLLDLLEDDYDYLHLTIFYINMLQHKFGDAEETRKGWELIDEYIGKLREEDALFVIYSDHGHTNVDKTFAINRWLYDEGYLSLGDSGSKSSESAMGPMTALVGRLGSAAGGLLPKRVIEFLRPLYRRIVPPDHPSSMAVANDVDWHDSSAAATSQGPVYLNLDRLGEAYEDTKRELKSALRTLEYNGEPVLSSVIEGAEIYSGPYTEQAPDLMLRPTDGWEIYGGLPETAFIDEATSWTSGNHPTGILLMDGPDVASGRYNERSILDVMPTVLNYLDCPIPTDVDGTVFDDVFEGDLPPRETRAPIEGSHTTAPGADADSVTEQLRDLGYLE